MMPAAMPPPRPPTSSEPDRRRPGDERARRERARVIGRRRLGLVAGIALLTILGVVIGNLGGGARAVRAGSLDRASAGAPRQHGSPAAVTRAHARVTAQPPSPGLLPQTDAFPSSTNAQFRALMASLWVGIVHDSVSPALGAFFPEAAYVKLKAIGSANSDWSERLVGDYRLDIEAAHALLGSGAAHARLVGVDAVSAYGHWVPPGVCYNGIGYYEMPNARVVYREGGEERSFGIASMISWRGVWYVVHLGAILRSGEGGVVDEPAAGPGVSGPSSTC